MSHALRVRGIAKSFGANRVLNGISFDLRPGTVTALLGENGSGKSTLVKILAGVYRPDAGTVGVWENELDLPVSPATAHAAGLRFLHQDLGLVEELTIAENLALSGGSSLAPVRRSAEARAARELLTPFGVSAPVDTYVADLAMAQRSMLAIARVLGDGGRVVFLDEPTAALSSDDADRVFSAVRELCSGGAAVVFISHRLEEVLRLADHVLVLRDGHLVADVPNDGLTAGDLVEHMTGRRIEAHVATPDAADAGKALLSLRGITGSRLTGIDLDLRAGEVLGVTGLVGCGRSELARIVGGTQRARSGSLLLDGDEVRFRSASDAIAQRVVSVPQNRHRDGVLLDLTIRENLTLGDLRPISRRWTLRRDVEREEARRLIAEYDIRPADPEAAVRSLSGGNQQKVAVARAVRLRPRVLVLDEPSQGIDIGAREGIATIVRQLREQGVGVLLATSDLDELIDLADRVAVLDRGRLRTVLDLSTAGRDDLFQAVTVSGSAA